MTDFSYETLSTEEKRKILRERIAELERRHFDTVLNLEGSRACPNKSPEVQIDIANLARDVTNFESLIEYNKKVLADLS